MMDARYSECMMALEDTANEIKRHVQDLAMMNVAMVVYSESSEEVESVKEQIKEQLRVISSSLTVAGDMVRELELEVDFV